MKEIEFIKRYQSQFSGKLYKSKRMDIYPPPKTNHPFVIERGGVEVGCAYLYYDSNFMDPMVWIMYLKVYEQGQGHGSRIMYELCELADLIEVVLYLEPGPDKDSNLNHPELVSWYQRFGFVGYHTMERKPTAYKAFEYPEPNKCLQRTRDKAARR